MNKYGSGRKEGKKVERLDGWKEGRQGAMGGWRVWRSEGLLLVLMEMAAEC